MIRLTLRCANGCAIHFRSFPEPIGDDREGRGGEGEGEDGGAKPQRAQRGAHEHVRSLGLVMVPGKHLVKCEAQVSRRDVK